MRSRAMSFRQAAEPAFESHRRVLSRRRTLPGLVRNYVTPGTEPKQAHRERVRRRSSTITSAPRTACRSPGPRTAQYFNNAYDTDPTNPTNWSTLPYPLSGRKYYRGDQYYGNVFRLNDTSHLQPDGDQHLDHRRAPPDASRARHHSRAVRTELGRQARRDPFATIPATTSASPR